MHSLCYSIFFQRICTDNTFVCFDSSTNFLWYTEAGGCSLWPFRLGLRGNKSVQEINGDAKSITIISAEVAEHLCSNIQLTDILTNVWLSQQRWERLALFFFTCRLEFSENDKEIVAASPPSPEKERNGLSIIRSNRFECYKEKIYPCLKSLSIKLLCFGWSLFEPSDIYIFLHVSCCAWQGHLIFLPSNLLWQLGYFNIIELLLYWNHLNIFS